jgi:hypothetical protein
MQLDTFVGLSQRAGWIIQEAACIDPIGGGTYLTAWGGDWELASYEMEDGTVYREHLQADPLTLSGPCYFLALLNEEGEPVVESLWTEEEIAEWMGLCVYGDIEDQILGDLDDDAN